MEETQPNDDEKEKERDVEFLFDISKEIKQMYETPVIFLLEKDYSEKIFNIMCSIRTAISEGSKNHLIDIIVDFHLQWLRSVNELENFRNRLSTIRRDEIYQAISYTIDAMGFRLKHYKRYIEINRKELTNMQQADLNADLEIVEEMHLEITPVLLDKLKCFRNFTDNTEFNVKLNAEVDELFMWVDKIHDGLAMLLSKHLNFNMPHLSGDLTKTLQQIIDEVKTNANPSSLKMMEELRTKGTELGLMVRCTVGHNLEISKVVEKINVLEDRIKRLKGATHSVAVLALKNKKEYLERRLSSIENLKITLKTFRDQTDVHLGDLTDEELCTCEDYYQLRIFNHFLPPDERERLVTELCYLWDLAVFGERSFKSVISILSAADMKEEFTDELGVFFVDEHGRKIYKLDEDEDKLYQPNEQNELVPLTDDAEHVYFYDECGRYFVEQLTRQRVYKAHASASEYMMDSSGILLKMKEVRDGVVYYYDNCGRYYINSDGKHIYREEDTHSEYENDGLGNLVRIRSRLEIFEPCPDDANVTEDFKYLKRTVGPALRECIASCIMHQPADPIKYLSVHLRKYRENMEMRENKAREKELLDVEREIKLAEERAAAERAAMEAALLAQGGSETSLDSNLLKYSTLNVDDKDSDVATSAK